MGVIYLLPLQAWTFIIMFCLDSCSEQWNFLDKFGIPFVHIQFFYS